MNKKIKIINNYNPVWWQAVGCWGSKAPISGMGDWNPRQHLLQSTTR